MVIADFHHRLAAFVIDWHIRTIPVAVWGLWLFSRWFPEFFVAATGNPHEALSLAWTLFAPMLQEPPVHWTGIASLAAYLLYHPLVELLMKGDSPGKRMSGISVRTVNGAVPDAKAILLRNLMRAVEFLPFGYLAGLYAMWRSPEHARYGDRLAGTRVVMRKA